MIFTLSMNLDNAQFDELPHKGVAQVLAALSESLALDGFEFAGEPTPEGATGSLRDHNGNHIGQWAITAEEAP